MATTTKKRKGSTKAKGAGKKGTKAKGAGKKGKAETGPKNKGKTLGLNVRQTWMHLFEKNEKAAKKDKMTDEQILKFMQKEFPSRANTSFEFSDVRGVQNVRNGYNRGVFTGGQKPKAPSYKYNEEGEAVTARGKPLSEAGGSGKAKGAGKGKSSSGKSGKSRTKGRKSSGKK